MIGLFINTIPVRIQCEDGTTFAELMKQAQERAVASQKYETYPLYDIQARTTQRQNLITHLMIFENYPVGQYMESIGQDNRSSIAISNVQMEEQTNYDFNITVIPGESLNIYFEYNAKVYDRASMERIREHFVQILHQVVADADIQVKQVELLTEGEKDTFFRRLTIRLRHIRRRRFINCLKTNRSERPIKQPLSIRTSSSRTGSSTTGQTNWRER